MGMRILTAGSSCHNAIEAVAQIKEKLVPKDGILPDFLLIYYTENYSEKELWQAFTVQFPEVNLAGIMTDLGSFNRQVTAGFPEEVNSASGTKASSSRFSVYKMKSASTKAVQGGVFAMAFFAERGAFGSVLVPVEKETELKVSKAVRDAQELAGRLGVMPDLMLLYQIRTPVRNLRAEINNMLGPSIPIVGGGIPDTTGDGSGFTRSGTFKGKAFYLMTLLYLPCQVVVESHSTCEQEKAHARITRADNCVIAELDNQPAADLFFRWIGFNTADMSISEMQGLLPKIDNNYFIGRQKNTIRGDISYDVSVIRDVTSDRALITGRPWNDQDEISLMRNDNADLFKCFLASNGALPTGKLLGALHMMCLSFCNGTNKEGFRKKVVAPVRELYGDKSFLVGSLFGEFGKDMEGGLILGNYTVSTVYFMEW